MFCNCIAEENHINIVVKVLFLLTRWFLRVQCAGKVASTCRASACLCKRAQSAFVAYPLPSKWNTSIFARGRMYFAGTKKVYAFVLPSRRDANFVRPNELFLQLEGECI